MIRKPDKITTYNSAKLYC